MRTPTVNEVARRLEPVTQDTFIESSTSGMSVDRLVAGSELDVAARSAS
jgi:hypothetical protein